jgi:hypothetical protein
MNMADKKYGSCWYKRIYQTYIYKKYEIYGYTSLDKLSEWNQLVPKKQEGTFLCKKEYQYINPLDEHRD